jgi:hypothetical protein
VTDDQGTGIPELDPPGLDTSGVDDGIPDLDLPPPPPPPPPRPSQPQGLRTAARAEPLPEEKKKITKQVLREGAVEVLLNGSSILKEVVEDFRSSDKFFKYKALILSVWFVLAITSIGVSCSGGPPTGNSFGARLIIAGEDATLSYMVKNDSDNEWQQVVIEVNGGYYATADTLRPHGDISLSPRLMVDRGGKEAPQGLKISDVHVNCSEGDTFLLKGGKPQ